MRTFPENVFIESDGYICMKAVNYQEKRDTSDGGFRRLEPCTREGSAIKAYPVTTDFMKLDEKPYVVYRFEAAQDGEYNIRFYSEASTPVVYEREQYICFALNGEAQTLNTVIEHKKQFFLSTQWSRKVTNYVKITDDTVTCRKELSKLRFYAVSPAIALVKIALYSKGARLKESYV